MVAAVSILAHMSHYVNDEGVQDVDIVPLDAQVEVLKEGIAFGLMLVAACFRRILLQRTQKTTKSNRPFILCLIELLFLLTANRIFELRYCRFGWLSYANVLFLMPYREHSAEARNVLAEKYAAYVNTVCGGLGLGSNLEDLPFFLPVYYLSTWPIVIDTTSSGSLWAL